MAVKYQSAHRWPRAIKFNHHHLVLWSFLGISQWVYVRDDMSKGLKIMSLGVINHGMSLSVLYHYIRKMRRGDRLPLTRVLVHVRYLSSSEAYTNNWGLFGKENYLTFDWLKHFLKILRRSEVTINLTRRLKKTEASEFTPCSMI